ncbi:unnamed protein product [Coffea canephora]|uniref:Disease resistance protein RGA3 n=1 Tax=Coffea canephora TaxID=49390 RepID=A0A068U720_COFCA|nr:unnamed protein product [Coffea canephora]
MADAVLGSTTQVLVQTAINSASEQIGQFVGFKKDLQKLKDTLTEIQAFLSDAEKKQVTENSAKLWLENLERVAFDAENLLDDFNYEMIRREVEIRNQMKRKKINMDLISIHERRMKLGLQPQNGARDALAISSPSGEAFMKNRETDSVTVDASFVGRDGDVSAIVTQLTATNNNETISVLPIVGMGGIGKTTVARKVFNDPNIEKHFEKRMWVCVSEDFNANRLFGMILQSLQGREPEAKDREARVKKLKELLDGKKYLLLLDDVWNKESTLSRPWNDFLGSLKGTSQAKGSWILLTTRDQQVATITRISSPKNYSLERLSVDQCWSILKENAFGTGNVPGGLKDIGLKIAQKCQGLALAASVLGGMLRNTEINKWCQILETGLQNIGEVGDGSITKILKLSFDHLPYPALKKCFAYCSIFPQDFEMERNQLIQLWAAEGFLHSDPRKNMCMEEVGNDYFTILLASNLFQDAQKDGYGNVLNCKMHDLVHDMVQSISKCRTLRLEEPTEADFHGKSFRYLVLERSCGEEIPPFPRNQSFRNITTLVLLENRSIDDGLITFLACLRVLNIASSDATELPKSIGKLSHLRYLDSSDTPVETLPDSLCKLYNLQTLRLRDCKSLTKFPNNFKNLVNLRHFDFFPYGESSDLTPLEIGQLRSLQTLPFFNIGIEAGRQIGELRNLKNLSGRLQLRNLELVKSKEEAESANLIGKPNIDKLRLQWNEIDNSRNNDSEYNQVLEGLQTHQNLKGLIIERFFGDRLSKWIGELGRLVKFKLQNCKNCKELPTLGNMPFLRFLHLCGLDSLASIGPSFYGRSVVQNLILYDMPNLREWMEATVDDGTVVVFPVLHTMRIINCPQLATFPNYFPRLKELNIWKTQNGSALMTYICSGISTLTRLSVESVNGLTKVPNSLETLTVRKCHSLESISIPKGRKYLAALQGLRISKCDGLTHLSILQISESEWDSTSSPFSFPIDLTRTPSLSLVDISECKKLTDLPKLYLFDALPPPQPYFPSLSKLDLYGWPHWESLPEQLQHLSALTALGLSGFGVKSLPDWFGKLSSLEELDLSNCRKLENLPSHQSMRSLTRLNLLCNPESSSSSSTDPNSEWSKISHIPELVIDGQRISI